MVQPLTPKTNQHGKATTLLVASMLETAIASAIRAGGLLNQRFTASLVPRKKSPRDIGLQEDIDSEEILIRSISRKFPSHRIISEEAGSNNKAGDFEWIIDPLDGTNNYALGLPYYAISIGVRHLQETIFGVVYQPTTGDIYHAIRDNGAFVNGRPIRCKRVSRSPRVASLIQGTNVDPLKTHAAIAAMESKYYRVLRTWCPSLDWCMLSRSRIHALASVESEKEDQIAGMLIAQESGCTIRSHQATGISRGAEALLAGSLSDAKTLGAILRGIIL